jgi:hypothetical protein
MRPAWHVQTACDAHRHSIKCRNNAVSNIHTIQDGDWTHM